MPAQRLRGWHHSGFQVYWGPPVTHDDTPAPERLIAYIIRPSFAGTRLVFDSSRGRVQYRTAKGFTMEMDALDWIVLVISHIPDPHEHMVRYYGHYSNAARGSRRKRDLAVQASPAAEASVDPDSPAEVFASARRQSWARLLKKIYEVDPLTCARCGSAMRVIAVIEEAEPIYCILQHLGLWKISERAPPPRLFPHKLEAFLATLPPRQAQQLRASTDSLFWDDVPVQPE